MRKSDRAIDDFSSVCQLLYKCDTIRLGLFDENYPYVLPLSFGMEVTEEKKIVLYFHGAQEGKKCELIKRNNHVCVEADLLRGYRDTGHSVTADYKSVIGFGTAEKVTDAAERVKGLQLLLNHCKTSGYSAAECANSPHVAVYKITLTEVTGKRRFPD